MDDSPHPRVLFEAVPDDEMLERLAALVPTHGVLGSDVKNVHASDWDLVVSFGPFPTMPSKVHVLSFGGRRFGSFRYESSWHEPCRDGALHARSVAVSEQLPGPLRSLVQRSIVDQDPGPGRFALRDLPPGDGHQALAVVGAEHEVWAAFFRCGVGTWAWALPEETTNHVEWLIQILDILHSVDPDRFPGSTDWKRQPAWGTPEIRSALADLDIIERERADLLRELAAREARARVELDVAVSSASEGPQKVLTADGPDLEASVAALLVDLGFTVQQMDEHHAQESGGRLEDLRVGLTDDGWTCLAEVKGYTAGAKVRDVPRICGRPSVRFAATEGREPDAVWHIVNAWRSTDPGTREVAIPQEHDLAVLADAHGCLIDTRDLFRAWRDVSEGTADVATVRASMQAAVGRWSWPPS